jgi:hypothetical protein
MDEQRQQRTAEASTPSTSFWEMLEKLTPKPTRPDPDGEEVVQTVGRPPILDPAFSTSSYGFRPGRSPHDALSAARQYVADGE